MGKKIKNSNTKTRQKKIYIPVYTREQYNKDESNFNKSLKNGDINWGTFQRLMVNDLCNKSNILDSGSLGCVKIEDAISALKNPSQNWKTLLMVSDELMRISPHYYRLNNLYSNMALFCWWIDLYDVKPNADKEVVKNFYGNLAAKLENMHLKHEFSKIMRCLPYQDIYCGLVVENNTDFFIQKINYNICKLYQIQDGLYNFKINFDCISPKDLGAYPSYVQQEYINYIDKKKNGINVCNWYLPPADKQICIKMNYQWTYPYPIMIGLVKDILDLEVYKKLKLQSARTDNYKAIMVEVPIDTKSVDKPLLTPDTLGIFAQINRESMNDDIGIIHTLGSTGQPISFKDSSNTRNNVGDAVDELYNSSGASKELFNGSSSGTAVTFSVENDSGFIYGLYRQFERWMNRYIKLKKYNKSTFKFYFYLLDITTFNRDVVSKRYKEACTLGATVIDKWLASLDMTPSRTLGSYTVHKDIFDFKNNFVPLSTSYTTSDSGRPTNASKNMPLDTEGEKTADGNKNDT